MLSRPKLTVHCLFSPVSSSFVLVTFALVALGLLGDTKLSADEKDDRPVVMISAGPLYIGKIGDANDKYVTDAIYREIVRQAIMITLREEFGLPTRDDSLLEPMDKESDHFFEIDVKTVIFKSVVYTISQRGKQLYEKQFNFKVGYGSYHRFAVKMEDHSQKELIDFFKEAGYKPRKNKMIAPEDSEPLPDELELRLRTMNHLSQFRAVRELHRLLTEEGETTERVSGLVRGYSNLSQMMFSTLDARSEVFGARAMLYSRRMRRVSQRSTHSLATEAYSDAMLGFPNRARGHFQSCIKRCEAEKTEPADWLPLINSYCGYRNSEIEEIMNDDSSSLQEVAALFRFRSALQAELADTPSIKDATGRAVLDVIPTCLWVYDRLTYNCGVSSGHTWTRAAPLALSYQLGDNLPDWTELPDNVMELVEDAEDDEFDALTAAEIANEMIAAAEFDKQEPSFAVLGRNIEAWNVMQVYQKANFYKYNLASSAGDLIHRMEPVFENHPDADLIRTLGIDLNGTRQEYVKALENYHFKNGNYFSTHEILRRINGSIPLANMSLGRATQLALHSCIYNEQLACCWTGSNSGAGLSNAYSMKTISRDSPVRIATLLRLDWENNKQNFDQWMEEFKEHPIISLTAARVLKKQDGNLDRAAKYYNRFLESSPDAYIIRELAKAEYYSGSGDWQKTLERTFDTPDLRLDHSTAAATIAFNLMHEGDFEEALPWAQRANQSGSASGMRCLAKCLTCLGKLDEASNIWRRELAHYKRLDTAVNWVKWCAANEHEDLQYATKTRKEIFSQIFKNNPNLELELSKIDYAHHLYARDYERTCKSLERLKKKTGLSQRGTFFLFAFSDVVGDTERRDEVLQELLEKGKQEPSIYSSAAVVMKKYFETGTFDDELMKKQLSGVRRTEGDFHNMTYAIISVRINRDGQKADKQTLNYLTTRARVTTLNDGVRPMIWSLLRELGVSPETLDKRKFIGGWARGDEAKNRKAFLETSLELSDETIEKARSFEFNPKRKSKTKAK